MCGSKLFLKEKLSSYIQTILCTLFATFYFCLFNLYWISVLLRRVNKNGNKTIQSKVEIKNLVCSWVGGRGDSAGVTDYVFRKESLLHPSTTGEKSCLCAQYVHQPSFTNRFIEILEKWVYTAIKTLTALEPNKQLSWTTSFVQST